MSIPKLSFGIELEGILLFHESLLEPHIPVGMAIKKDHVLGERDADSLQPVASWVFRDVSHATNILSLTTQPSQIAAGLLRPSDRLALTVTTQDVSNKHTYTAWKVMQERSVPALSTDQKQTRLSTLFEERDIDIEMWDSQAIEFVSRVYSSTDDLNTALDDVRDINRHIKTDHSAVITNENCGFHVHVGLPDGKPLPIRVLRVLAFLAIIYEDEISKLHEKHRIFNNKEISSNRVNMFAEYGDPRDRETNAENEQMQSTLKSVGEIRRVLFQGSLHTKERQDAKKDQDFGGPQNAKELQDPKKAYRDLQFQMGRSRAYFINWAYIDRQVKEDNTDGEDASVMVKNKAQSPVKIGPATVEFRQHAATFDPVPIGHWVRFCVALVGLAYKWADQGEKCLDSIKSWSDEINLEVLMDYMDLPQETIEYFRGRLRQAEAEDRKRVQPLWEESDQDYDLQNDFKYD